MRNSSLVITVIGIILVVSLLGILFYPSASDFMESNKAWNGINSFIKDFKAENSDSVVNISPDNQQQVFVSIPYTDYSSEELERIGEFVSNGNLLLLLDDFGYGNSLLEHMEIEARFSNSLLLDPLFNYKNQYLPRITEFSTDVKETGIEAITLNHASTLINVGQSHIIALSSSASFEDVNRNGLQDEEEPSGPFTVAAEYDYGRGKVVLLSDPSITINTMVGYNNNYEFINHLININGTPDKIIFDRAHIAKTPLDVSKINTEQLMIILNNNYVILGMVVLIFIFTTAYAFRKEEVFG